MNGETPTIEVMSRQTKSYVFTYFGTSKVI